MNINGKVDKIDNNTIKFNLNSKKSMYHTSKP